MESNIMNYTDKEIQIATQVSYINILDDYITDYHNDNNGDYPTLQYILSNEKYGDDIVQEYYRAFYLGCKDMLDAMEYNVMYDATLILNLQRQVVAIKDINDIIEGNSFCSDWKVVAVMDDNKNSGMYAVMFETPDNKAVIAFRGSELP